MDKLEYIDGLVNLSDKEVLCGLKEYCKGFKK